MICLWCHIKIQESITWGNLLWPKKPTKMCRACRKKLIHITGPTCQRCGRNSKEKTCLDCDQWKEKFTKDPLKQNISIFSYNDFMKEIISQWKYRGDYVLVKMFEDLFVKYFLKHFTKIAQQALIIPIPLSEERLFERGFNQAEALANLLSQQAKISPHILKRKHSEKQSKKSRIERLRSKNPFILNQTLYKPVVLVDDIYTTGTTLRHAAQVLIDNGCPAVYSITLVRG